MAHIFILLFLLLMKISLALSLFQWVAWTDRTRRQPPSSRKLPRPPSLTFATLAARLDQPATVARGRIRSVSAPRLLMLTKVTEIHFHHFSSALNILTRDLPCWLILLTGAHYLYTIHIVTWPGRPYSEPHEALI